jgi:hypothetical protein
MNAERVLQLADFIEVARDNLSFDMRTFGRDTACGTACCIAGFACVAFEEAAASNLTWMSGVSSTARDLLGLDPDQATELFLPTCEEWYDCTPATAASLLRDLAATGIVDWEKATGIAR